MKCENCGSGVAVMVTADETIDKVAGLVVVLVTEFGMLLCDSRKAPDCGICTVPTLIHITGTETARIYNGWIE